MIKTYETIKDENDNSIYNLTKLFIIETGEQGEILKSRDGTSIIPVESGTLFIVDDWLIPQLDKVKFLDGVLSVKEGEELVEPVKSEKELQREELLRQIAELDAAEDEPVDIEEQTDALLLGYTEQPSE